MREVRDQTGLEVRWRFFSLEEINRVEGKKHPWEREWSYGWSMMRIGALLRRKDPALLDAWYERAGRALHEEGRQPHRPEVAEELLAELGLDPGLVAEAIADPTTHDDVRTEHDQRRRRRRRSACRRCSSPTASACSARSSSTRPSATRRCALWEHVLGVAALPAPVRDPAAEVDAADLAPIADDVPAVPRRPATGRRSRTRRPDRRRRHTCLTSSPRTARSPRWRDVWAGLDELLAGLDDDDWATPTCLPGWDVQAVVAHVIGTESMLLGEPRRPSRSIRPVRTHVRNDIGRFNEAWVVSMADVPPADVLARFRDHVARRLDALRRHGRTAAWDAVGFTPAGQDTYGRFMRIRVFDCWLHEQDIRDAVGRPGGEAGPAAELALDEMASAMGYVVGKRAGAAGHRGSPSSSPGPAGAHDRRRGRPSGPPWSTSCRAPPTVTLTMPTGVFARLGGGRVDPGSVRDQIDVDGDTELGERIVANLAYTI